MLMASKTQKPSKADRLPSCWEPDRVPFRATLKGVPVMALMTAARAANLIGTPLFATG